MPDLDFILKGIKGNGITLGLTNGDDNFAHKSSGYDYKSLYGKNIGYTEASGAIETGGVGITTDSAKSGIESEINLNIKYVIKY